MGIYNVYIIFDLAPETKTGNKDDIYVVHEVQATGPRAGPKKLYTLEGNLEARLSPAG